MNIYNTIHIYIYIHICIYSTPKESSGKLSLPAIQGIEQSMWLFYSQSLALGQRKQLLNNLNSLASICHSRNMFFRIVKTLDNTNYLWHKDMRKSLAWVKEGGRDWSKHCREQIPHWQLTDWGSRQSKSAGRQLPQIICDEDNDNMTDGTGKWPALALRGQWKFKSIEKRLNWIRFSRSKSALSGCLSIVIYAISSINRSLHADKSLHAGGRRGENQFA